MPNFMYTIIFVAGVSWFGWYKFLMTKPPESVFHIIIFLILLLIAASLSLSVPIYFVLVGKSDYFSDLNKVYRKALKWGIFIGLIITVFLAIRAFT